jgi:hypothetical protein
MPIFKSHKAIFFAKLVLLIPLSLITVYTAAMATGGGHGNYFPLVVILGPLNILFAMPIDGPKGEMYFFCGGVFHYIIYALLLKFIKSNKTFVSLSIFHVISCFIGMFFLGISGIFVDTKNSAFCFVMVTNSIIFSLWGLIIWLLKSIHKSRGLW